MFKKAFLFTLLLLIISAVTSAETIPVPTGQEVFSNEIIPQGKCTVNISINLGEFSGPVDVYFAVQVPGDPNIYLLKSDYTFQPLSMGLTPLKTNTKGPINDHIFKDIPIPSLPSGTYYIYLAITPAGSIDTYYLLTAYFEISSVIVQGFVFQGNPIVVTDDPANAPVGYSPAGGADLQIVGINKDVVATGTTSYDGGFRICNIPVGYHTLEIRLDSGSQEADATVPFTSIPDTTIDLGKSYPVTREQATELVLSDTPENARVLGSLQPLPIGATLKQGVADESLLTVLDKTVSGALTGDGDALPIRTVENEEWFFFVDMEPRSLYAHDVQYVFIDADSGDVTRIEGLSWPPQVNDAILWFSDLDYTIYNNIDLDNFDPENIPEEASYTLTAEVIQEGDSEELLTGQFFVNSQISSSILDLTIPLKYNNTDPKSVFFLNILTNKESAFEGDFTRMRNFMEKNKVSRQTNHAEVCFPQPKAVPMDKIADAASKHYWDRINWIKLKVEERLKKKLHSTLIVHFTAHQDDNEVTINGKKVKVGNGNALVVFRSKPLKGTLMPADFLFDGIMEIRACRVRILLTMCYAEVWADRLHELFNALPENKRPDVVIYYSSKKNESTESRGLKLVQEAKETSKSYPVHRNQMRVGSNFINAVLDTGKIMNGDLVGLLDNKQKLKEPQFGVGEFYQAGRHPDVKMVSGDPDWCKEGSTEGCGDGVINGDEQCDGSELNDQTCESLGLGFTGGTLTCTAECQFDTSQCETGVSCQPDNIIDLQPPITSMTINHTVFETDCPTPGDTVSICNKASENVNVSVTCPHSALDCTYQRTLSQGSCFDATPEFKCSTTQSFSGNMLINAVSDSSYTQSESITINVNIN